MKRLLSILLVFIVLLGVAGCGISPRTSETSTIQVPTVFNHNGKTYTVNDYLEIEELFIMELTENGLGSYQIYDASELTAEMLENRTKDKVIIERCVGMVVGNQGDGTLLNYSDPDYYYISYRSCGQEVYDGTILVSYMVYNPNTTYYDDIIERYDFVICRDYEQATTLTI